MKQVLMKNGIRVVLLAGFLALFGTSAFAKQVTVNISDLSFELAKSILLSQRGGIDLKGLSDEAIRTVLDNKKAFEIDDSLLPQDVRVRLESQRKLSEVTLTMEEANKWAQMGRGIGIATREGLNAISTEAAAFANTTPGKFTMVMIAWKVMGADFLKAVKGYIISVPLLIFWCILFWKYQMKLYWGGNHKKTELVAIEGTDKKERQTVIEWVEPLVTQMKSEAKENYSNFICLVGLKTAAFVIVGGVIFLTI